MKKVTVFSTITVAILISAIFVFSVHNKSSTPDTPAVAVTDVDFATQTVISENLFQESDIQFSNNSLNVNGYYFDGIRLYISISSNNKERKFDLEPSSFCLKSENNEQNADIVYKAEDIERVIGENTDDFIVIFNSFNYNSDAKFLISYNNSNTEWFYIKETVARHYEIGRSNEEMILNYADFGTTSTLLNCNLNAFPEGSSFKFQTKDGVYTVYLIKKDRNNYSFLIPLKLNELSEGYLIVNGQDKNVELRAFVNFAKSDPESVI